MPKRKSKPTAVPRQVGDLLVTNAIVAPRKRSKRLPDPKQGHFFADRPPQAKSANADKMPEAAPARTAAPSEDRTDAAAGGVVPLFQYYGNCCDKGEGDTSNKDKPIHR